MEEQGMVRSGGEGKGGVRIWRIVEMQGKGSVGR